MSALLVCLTMGYEIRKEKPSPCSANKSPENKIVYSTLTNEIKYNVWLWETKFSLSDVLPYI